MEADPPLFDECSATLMDTELEREEVKREQRNQKWQNLKKAYVGSEQGQAGQRKEEEDMKKAVERAKEKTVG